MADEREWVRVEVIWDGGLERDPDDEMWDWEEGMGVLPSDLLLDFEHGRAEPGLGLSKRRRKKLRGGDRDDR